MLCMLTVLTMIAMLTMLTMLTTCNMFCMLAMQCMRVIGAVTCADDVAQPLRSVDGLAAGLCRSTDVCVCVSCLGDRSSRVGSHRG